MTFTGKDHLQPSRKTLLPIDSVTYFLKTTRKNPVKNTNIFLEKG